MQRRFRGIKAVADDSSTFGGPRATPDQLEEEIHTLKSQLSDVVAQYGLRHAEVQSIMDRLDPLIAELMRRRLQERYK